MTQAERLIRNLCDHARGQVKADTPETVRVQDAPAQVRAAVSTLRRLRPTMERAEAVLREAGYDIAGDDEGGHLLRSYTVRREARNQRLQEITRLQNAAVLDTMNTTGMPLQVRLQRLQADLAKVIA